LTVASWIGNRFSNEVHEKQVEQYAMKYITPEAPEVPVPPHEQGAWFKEAYSTGDAKGKQWVGNGMLQRESSTTSTKQAHRTAGQETNACIDLNTYDLGEKVRPDSVEKDNIT
jgi:hypothetical protein